MSDLVSTLRDEARFRPTIWGDARPLLIAAADEIERLRELVRSMVLSHPETCVRTGKSDNPASET
jgi:hypothetical protein